MPWPDNLEMSCPLDESHSRTILSMLEETINSLTGENAISIRPTDVVFAPKRKLPVVR